MKDSFKGTKEFDQIVERVEKIYSQINELFGDNSSEEGLFYIRNTILHQFAGLASSFHQMNSIEYLKSNEKMSSIFDREINTANFRTINFKDKALRIVRKNIPLLEKYASQIIELNVEVEYILEYIQYYSKIIDHSYYLNVLNSVEFYVEEIRSRILEPAEAIIDNEIVATNKLISTIDNQFTKYGEVSNEEIARMCEVLSWGLETPPGWKRIKNDSSELAYDLQKKIGSLKAMVTNYLYRLS